MPTREQIEDALRGVIDPELRKDIVTLGMVRSIEQPEEGTVNVVVSLTTAGCPIRNHFQTAVVEKVQALGVSQVNVGFDVLSDSEKQTLAQRLGRSGGLPQGALAAVKNVICIGSGKGGVGKSTVTTNLAAALQAEGKSAAALDADVWGYSIPRMLGVHGRPKVSADRKILPLEGPAGREGDLDRVLPERARPGHHVARTDAPQGDPPVPRGRGLGRARLPADRPAAGHRRRVDDARPAAAPGEVRDRDDPAAGRPEGGRARAAETALRFDLEIAGVIENMSGFTTPSGERFTIFGEGGGQLLADELDVPLLGKIPLQEELRICADEGRPLVLEDPNAPASQALYHAARGIIAATPQELGVLQEPSGPPMPEITGTALPMASVADQRATCSA